MSIDLHDLKIKLFLYNIVHNFKCVASVNNETILYNNVFSSFLMYLINVANMRFLSLLNAVHE